MLLGLKCLMTLTPDYVILPSISRKRWKFVQKISPNVEPSKQGQGVNCSSNNFQTGKSILFAEESALFARWKSLFYKMKVLFFKMKVPFLTFISNIMHLRWNFKQYEASDCLKFHLRWNFKQSEASYLKKFSPFRPNQGGLSGTH